MSYVPAGNVNVGFWVVANCVQPTVAFRYAHFHEVGALLEYHVKVTLNGPVYRFEGSAWKFDTGAETAWLTVISPVLISSSLPPALVAVRLMSYVPAGNVNVGFWVVANCVQPTVAFRYAHFHEVGVLLDVSLKVTLNGPVPVWGSAWKFDTGAETAWLTVTSAGLDLVIAPSGIGCCQVDVIRSGRERKRRVLRCCKLRPADSGILIRPFP